MIKLESNPVSKWLFFSRHEDVKMIVVAMNIDVCGISQLKVISRNGYGNLLVCFMRFQKNHE